jgi:methylmalonyl-CoA mutase
MSEAPENPAFAAEFAPATRAQWLKLVEKVLKGAAFDQKFVAKTYDGLRIEPLYARAADAKPVAGRTPGGPWQVMVRVDHPDPAAANTEALHELDNGATGLTLVFAGSIGAYGYGLPASAEALARALAGVYLDAIAVALDLSAPMKDAAPLVAELVKKRGLAPQKTEIRFGHDPISAHAFIGSSPLTWPGLAPRFAAHVAELADMGFKGPLTVADGRLIHSAGGSEAQELAYVLSAAVAYLRALEAAGIALDDARRMIEFRLAADADQFLTIAKLRGLRKLWAHVEEACGLTPQPAFVTAETAWRMTTQRDPYVNMLRATIATAAAGLGGANAVSVLPFTAALGLPDRFARRIARNTQLILLEESNLAKVADPAAGSGAVEDLTAKLCVAAWSLFQEIERAGGAWAAFESGLIQQQVAAVRAEHGRAVATRKDALTGASAFPDLQEAPVAALDAAPVAVAPDFPAVVKIEPLPYIRLAAPFEALRDASDRVLAKTGSRPKIFLANLGTPADFTARVTFAKNFFEAGGIEAVVNDGFAGHDDMAAAFKASGAKLVCVCATDAIYAKEAAAAAKALAAAGATHIYMAGRPKDLEAALRQAGVQSFVYTGCDALLTLSAAHEILGIRR